MPAPTITPLPTPPSRGDAPETFNAEADAFLGALPTLQTEVNAVATWMDTTATQVSTDASVATSSRLRASNAVPFTTWTALAAATGMSAGDKAQVLAADTGTHTDPVVGGTVSNAGVYTYSASPAGWQRVGDLDSKTANDLGAAQVALATTQAGIATTQATNAGNSAAQAAATAATVGAMPSESIKARPFNLQVAGQTSVIKQALGSLTNILTSDNSVLAIRFYFDPERMHQNCVYALCGNAPGGTVGRFQLGYIPRGTTTANGANRQQFVFNMRRASGSAYTVRGGTMPEVSGWYIATVRRTTGGVYTVDVFSCADGTKVADGAANALTQTLGGIDTMNQTHWYIGDAVDVSGEATLSTARGQNANAWVGWDGAIAEVMIANNAGSDADWQAIALGADPLTTLGASNFTYYRRFRGTDSTSLSARAGTSDTTAAATVIGDWLPGGTPGRQGTTDYITLDPVKDYHCWGLRRGATSERVTFSGNCGGVAFTGELTAPMMPDYQQRREVRFWNNFIEARFLRENGTPWMPWTRICPTTATGVTNGLTFTEHARSMVGLKILLTGQSQCGIMMGTTTLGYKLNSASATHAFWYQSPVNTTQFAFQNYPLTGNAAFSDAFVAFVQHLQKYAPCGVQMVNNSLVGSSALDMIDDWSRTSSGITLNTQDLVNFSGNDVSCVLWQWFTTHQALGSAFGAQILDPVIRGYGTNAAAKWLGDGILRNGWALAMSPATRQTPTSAGPLTTDPNTSIADLRAVQRSWATSFGCAIGPEITDMKLAAGGGPHQDTASVRGNVRMGIRMAECVARAMGWSQTQDPTLSNPVFNGAKTTITLTAIMPNPGSRLRVDDEATYAANVQGLEISTDGGVTWSRSGFTAAISTTPSTRNTVVASKSSGDWTAFAPGQVLIKYAYGSPFGYGTSLEATELIRGGLYDGTEFESGLGLPFVPLAPTVVV